MNRFFAKGESLERKKCKAIALTPTVVLHVFLLHFVSVVVLLCVYFLIFYLFLVSQMANVQFFLFSCCY